MINYKYKYKNYKNNKNNKFNKYNNKKIINKTYNKLLINYKNNVN